MSIPSLIKVNGVVSAIKESETASGHKVRTVIVKVPYIAWQGVEPSYDYLPVDFWNDRRPENIREGQAVTVSFRIAGRMRPDGTVWVDLRGVDITDKA